ncbi:N-alpha-acetyltransferase 30A-like [Toxorhynchites rutilus septentrionalis]|uniref:N-alpha-acetyltransferase 30A-like n=1 Tax=Toxorhynchites rutilus septentrionalis TaxID=329112 RepID=UPI00247958CA|nr:N-alpha-acetyltransferase 30A-like [Toxorhynchites rutilus septentrionalis]
MEEPVDNNLSTATNGVDANATSTARSGKKKAKRKNKSKNVSTSPSEIEKAEDAVNTSLAGAKQNGVLEELHENSADKLSVKLEYALQLNRNGLTNGTVSGSDDHQMTKTEITTTVTKKKHRNRQKSKSQPAVVSGSEPKSAQTSENCVNNNVPESSSWVSSAPMHSTNGTVPVAEPPKPEIVYKVYESELQMPSIMTLIQKDLSEPYSIYTYRYFIHNWPKLCFLALHDERCVGAIVCKLDIHRQNIRRGYIAMLAVDKDYRKLKIGTTLVQKAIQAMLEDNADEVVLETEITNRPALRLYENLGFVRDKRLFHYYLNGVDALRLKLWFR